MLRWRPFVTTIRTPALPIPQNTLFLPPCDLFPHKHLISFRENESRRDGALAATGNYQRHAGNRWQLPPSGDRALTDDITDERRGLEAVLQYPKRYKVVATLFSCVIRGRASGAGLYKIRGELTTSFFYRRRLSLLPSPFLSSWSLSVSTFSVLLLSPLPPLRVERAFLLV